MKILSWRFSLNEDGNYDIFEEQDSLGNWIYIMTVKNIEDVLVNRSKEDSKTCAWCEDDATHLCPCGEPLCWKTNCINKHNKDERENPWV